MVYSVTVTNYLGESLKMELSDPKKSGFIIKEITGIGPGSADINTTELSTGDGSLFNSSRLTERNIVIKMNFDRVDSIEESRHRTYKYFPLKKNLKLVFKTDTRECEIEGYTESNEPNIFSKEEGTEISIICPDPYFKSINSSKILFFGVEPEFEFPFSNESYSEKLLEFGKINRYTEQNVFYDGDAETGLTIRMHAVGVVKNIVIYKIQTRESIRISTEKIEELTGQGLITGDDLIISTVKRDMYVHLIRSGMEINMLNAMDRKSDWLQLSKGDNLFAYTAEEGIPNLEFYIEYNTLYSGV